MFNPAFETITFIAPAVIEFAPPYEPDSDTAVIDEMEGMWGKSYDALMGLYESTNSEVTRAAVRQIVMSADWTIERYFDDFNARVEVLSTIPHGKNKGKYGYWTWANCEASDLRGDAKLMESYGDKVFAGFFYDLLAQIDEAQDAYRSEHAYSGRC